MRQIAAPSAGPSSGGEDVGVATPTRPSLGLVEGPSPGALAFELAPDAMLVLDAADRVLAANQAFYG